MKRLFVLGIFLFLVILIGIGCTTLTVPTGTSSLTATSTPLATETQTISPTPSIINETGELKDVVLFQLPKSRETISSGYALELTFSMSLDLESITTEDATQYINLFCNNIRITSWNGEVYVNPDEPDKMIVTFGEGTNFSCDPQSMVVVPVKGMLRVQGGGYIKGVPKDMEELPQEGTPEEHGGMHPKMGECPADFSENSSSWHKPQHQGEQFHMTPTPHGTEHPSMTPTPHQGEQPHMTPTQNPTSTPMPHH